MLQKFKWINIGTEICIRAQYYIYLSTEIYILIPEKFMDTKDWQQNSYNYMYIYCMWDGNQDIYLWAPKYIFEHDKPFRA